MWAPWLAFALMIASAQGAIDPSESSGIVFLTVIAAGGLVLLVSVIVCCIMGCRTSSNAEKKNGARPSSASSPHATKPGSFATKMASKGTMTEESPSAAAEAGTNKKSSPGASVATREGAVLNNVTKDHGDYDDHDQEEVDDDEYEDSSSTKAKRKASRAKRRRDSRTSSDKYEEEYTNSFSHESGSDTDSD
jgi:hypothetical protein